MQATVHKWGNSLAVIIPASILKELGINNGSNIDLTIDKHRGAIIIKPIKKKHLLIELLQKINDSNLHEEIQAGEPRGKEIW